MGKVQRSVLLLPVDITEADIYALRSFATASREGTNQEMEAARGMASFLIAALSTPVSRASQMAVLMSLEGSFFINYQTCSLGSGGNWREARVNWVISLLAVVALLGTGIPKAVLPALFKIPLGASA